MTRLSEALILARSRQSSLDAVSKLNCWGSDITDVSILKQMRNVEILALSINKISSLAPFQDCKKLQELYLRKNNIQDIREILHLQCLPQLKYLWLEENPFVERAGANYRSTVLRALPNLKKLDNVEVTQEELENAQSVGMALQPLQPLQSEEDIYEDADEAQQQQQQQQQLQQQQSQKSDGYIRENSADLASSSYNTVPEEHSSFPYDNSPGYQDQGPVQLAAVQDTRAATLPHKMSSRIMNPGFLAPSPNDSQTQLQYQQPGSLMVPNTYASQTNLPYQRRLFARPEPGGESLGFQNGMVPQENGSRGSRLLSATLCLIKELDYDSLMVLKQAVRCRIDEHATE